MVRKWGRTWRRGAVVGMWWQVGVSGAAGWIIFNLVLCLVYLGNGSEVLKVELWCLEEVATINRDTYGMSWAPVW